MGFALAEVARDLGADVTLVAGPVALATPVGVKRIDVVTAEEMLQACNKIFPRSDVFIATAAVGDYAPLLKTSQKIKKSAKPLTLTLKPTTDVLKCLAQEKRKGQIVVGFAAETDQLLKYAGKKLSEKNLDLIVANDVSKKHLGFASDQNAVSIVGRNGKLSYLPPQKKTEIALGIWQRILVDFFHGN